MYKQIRSTIFPAALLIIFATGLFIVQNLQTVALGQQIFVATTNTYVPPVTTTGTVTVTPTVTTGSGSTSTGTTGTGVVTTIVPTTITPTIASAPLGSIENPYTNLADALAVVTPGDTIYLRAGTYTASNSTDFLVQDINGTSTNPIVIQNYNNEEVIINASTGIFSSTQGIFNVLNSSHIIIDGIIVENNLTGRGVSIDNSSNITFRNSRVRDVAQSGIYINGENITIQNNHVTGAVLSNEGMGNPTWERAVVAVNSTNITFRNNTVHDNFGDGISAEVTSNAVFAGNRIYNNYNSNIYLNNAINSSLISNYIYATSDTYNSDSGRPDGVLMTNEEGEPGYNISNILIVNNFIGEGVGRSISYVDLGGTFSNVRIYHNNFRGQTEEALYFDEIPTTLGNRVINNIIYRGTNGIAISTGNPSGFEFSHNVWVGALPTGLVHIASYTYTPQFTGPLGNPSAATAYTLPDNSPLVGRGTPLTEVRTDYFGTTRNATRPTIGMFESTASINTNAPAPIPVFVPFDNLNVTYGYSSPQRTYSWWDPSTARAGKGTKGDNDDDFIDDNDDDDSGYDDDDEDISGYGDEDSDNNGSGSGSDTAGNNDGIAGLASLFDGSMNNILVLSLCLCLLPFILLLMLIFFLTSNDQVRVDRGDYIVS